MSVYVHVCVCVCVHACICEACEQGAGAVRPLGKVGVKPKHGLHVAPGGTSKCPWELPGVFQAPWPVIQKPCVRAVTNHLRAQARCTFVLCSWAAAPYPA